MWKYTWVIVLAIILYRGMKSERNLLILLQTTGPNDLTKLKDLDQVKSIFKVEANIDGHMDREQDLEKMKKKDQWNFIVLTHNIESESDSLKYGDQLRRKTFIKDFSVYPFKTSPIRIKLMNAFFTVKGFIGDYLPFLIEGGSCHKFNLTDP